MYNEDVYGVSERSFKLTESQLMHVIDIGANRNKLNNWAVKIQSAISGFLLSAVFTATTVPRSSFQPVGAIQSDLVYGIMWFLIGFSVVAFVVLELIVRFHGKKKTTSEIFAEFIKDKKGVSTDNGLEKISSKSGMRIVNAENIMENNIINRKSILTQDVNFSEEKHVLTKRVNPIEGDSRIIRAGEESDALSNEQEEILKYLISEGVVQEKNITAIFENSNEDLKLILSKGLIALSGGYLSITSKGYRLVGGQPQV